MKQLIVLVATIILGLAIAALSQVLRVMRNQLQILLQNRWER